MTQETLNEGNRSDIRKKYRLNIPYQQKREGGEQHDDQTKLSPVLTNICVSLLVMALFAVCFHI